MNRSKGATACIAIGTIFVILGLLISFFSLALTPAAAPVPYTSDTRISDETYGTVYDFGQVLVIDQYGYIEYDGFSDEHYYIIGISLDSSDTVYLASLRVDEDTAVFDKLKDYAYDENAYVGDMYLKLCATAEPINDIDPDMKRYYYESLDTYKSYFTDTTDLEIGLTFYCEGTAAYSSTAIAGSAAYIVVAFAGIAMSAAGIICLIIGIVKKVRAKTPQYVMPGNGYYYNPQQNQWNNGMPVNNPQNQWNNGAPIHNPQTSGITVHLTTTPIQKCHHKDLNINRTHKSPIITKAHILHLREKSIQTIIITAAKIRLTAAMKIKTVNTT